MAELLGTDEFLVNRNDVTYTQQQETLMATLQDTDHLLINRAGQTYKITGSDLINSVVDPLEVTVVLAPVDGYTDTEVTAVPVVSGGKQPDGGYIFTYQWVTADDAAGTNRVDIAGATDATFTPDNAQVGLFLGCVVGTTDALGTSAEGEAYIGPIQVLAQAPVIADVAISEIYDGSNRFTDKEFPYVTTMAVAGEPAPTYEVKAKLSGTTFDFDVKSDAITDVEGGGIDVCETDPISNVNTADTSTYQYKSHTGAVALNTLTWDSANQGPVEVTSGSRPTTSFPESYWAFIKFDGAAKVNYGIPNSGTTKTVSYFYSNDGVTWTFDSSYNQSSGKFPGPFSDSNHSAVYWAIGYQTGTDNPLNVSSVSSLTLEPNNWYQYTIPAPTITLTFPSNRDFDCFEPGDVVQDPDVTVISKDEDANTITIDGGNWYTPADVANQNRDEKWSETGTITNSKSGSHPTSGPIAINAFDGNLTSTVFKGTMYTQTVDWTAETSIPFTKLEIIYSVFNDPADGNSSSNLKVTCNGVTKEIRNTTSPGAGMGIFTPYTEDVTSQFTSPFEGWSQYQDRNGSHTAVFGIKIDDKVLVDTDYGLKLVKEMPYDTKLTVASSENLELLTGDVFMTDGSAVPATQTPYKLVTTDIESVTTTDWTQYGDGVPGPFGEQWANMFGSTALPKVFDPNFELSLSTLNNSDAMMPVKSNDSNAPSTWDATAVGGITVKDNIKFVVRPDTKWFSGATNGDGGEGYIKVNGNPVTVTDAGTGSSLDNYQYAEISSAELGGSFNKIECVSSNQGFEFAIRIWGFYVDDKLFVDDEVVLTFPGDVSTNPDLRYFKPGDEIQGAPSVIATTSGWGQSYNDSLSNEVIMNNGDEFDMLSTKTYWWSKSNVGSNSFKFTRVIGGNNFLVYGYTSSQANQTHAGTQLFPGTGEFTLDASSFSTNYEYIRIYATGNGSMTFRFDSSSGEVKVISTGYPDSNTMVVDGGEWGGNVAGPVSIDEVIGGYVGCQSNPSIIDNVEFAVDAIYPNIVLAQSQKYESDMENFWNNGGNPEQFLKDEIWGGAHRNRLYFDTGGNGGGIGVGGQGPTKVRWKVNEAGTFYLYIGAPASFVVDAEVYANINNIQQNGTNLAVEWEASGTSGNQRLKITSNGEGGTFDMETGNGTAYLYWAPVGNWSTTPGASHVEYQTNGGEGTIVSVNTDDNTILLTNTGDRDNRWIIGETDTSGDAGNSGETGDAANAKNHYVAPASAVPITQDHAWCKLQIINDKAQVTSIQKDDPGFLPVPAKDYSIKFPAIFPTGNEPDDDLPKGVCVAAIVAAENSEGRSVKESNCFMPIDVNPDGAAGPITDSTPTTLTVASNANLSDFSPGDNLVMVNEDNDISSYTMQTSTIESVETTAWKIDSSKSNLILSNNDRTYTSGNGWRSALGADIISKTDETYIEFQLRDDANNNGDHRFAVILDDGSYSPGDQPTANKSFISIGYGSIAGDGTSSNLTGRVLINDGDSIRTQLNVFGDAFGGTSGPNDVIALRVIPAEGKVIAYKNGVEQGDLVDAAVAKGVDRNKYNFTSGDWKIYAAKWSNQGFVDLGEEVKLTFADPNPDLKFFRPGDVVQGVDSSNTYKTYTPSTYNLPPTTIPSSWTLVEETTIANGPQASISSPIYIYKFDNPVKNVQVGYFGANSNFVIRLWGSIDGLSWTSLDCQLTGTTKTLNSGSTSYSYICLSKLSETGEVNKCSLDNQTNSTAMNMQNTSYGVLSNQSAPVKVISTDLVNNTMTVDGGNWDVSNQSQVWSDLVTNPGGTLSGSVENGFNGALAAPYATYFGGAFPANCAELAIPVLASDTVFVICQSDVQPFLVDTGNGTQTFQKTSGANTRIDISSAFGTNVTSWKIGSTGNWNFAGIEINGKLLVDAAFDSQVWSNYVKTTNSWDPETTGTNFSEPAINGFDGNISTMGNGYPQGGSWIYFTPPEPITDVTSLRIFTRDYQGISLNKTQAFVPSTPASTTDVPGNWITVTSPPSTISQIAIQGLVGPASGRFSAIEVNGKLLIDAGVRDLGDSEVTYGPVTGTGTFQSADLNANTITLSVSNDRWIDTSNRLGINFYCRDNITVLNADNPKHVAMQQAIADAFDAFPVNVNARRTAIASSFYRLMEGETLSAEEFAILEETVTGAVNAQEPFALDGYYPLYYTAAKADAASSVGDHHVHNINGVNYYMPDGGTIYHGNYIAPETSTTDNNDSSY